MNDEHSDNYDLEYELEGIQKFSERALPEFYTVTRSRSRSSPIGGQKGIGRALIEACTAQSLQKYETLLDLESQTRARHDHGFLVGMACQIIETEIARLLAEPAKSVGETMLRHLQRKRKNKVKDYLQGWLEGRFPTMIGVQVFILMALRYGLESRDPEVVDFVNQQFRENYISLLASNRLGASLDKIKNQYRNPACHGTKVFSPGDYRDFSILSFGSHTLREWDLYGPEDDGAVRENAVFLNHLLGARVVPELHEDSAGVSEKTDIKGQLVSHFRKLLSISGSTSECQIEVHPLSSARSLSRDMSFCDASTDNDFRLNSKINIGYYYKGLQGDVEVTIFDVGTTGKLTIFMPQEMPFEGRINWFPDIHRNQCIILSGAPGLEHVFAVASRRDMRIRQKVGLPDNVMAYEVTGTDATSLAGRLVKTIQKLPPGSWAAGEFLFEIIE